MGRSNGWLGKHHTAETKLRISESLRRYWTDNGGSNPGVSSSPPANQPDDLRSQILVLEEQIAEGEADIRQTLSTKRTHEQELAVLKAAAFRESLR